MKRIKLLLGLGLVASAITLGLLGIAGAQSFYSGSTVSIAKDKVVDNTVFVAGSNIDIAGTVHGDVFCAGQTVTISGTITGDLFCVAQTITVGGKIEGSVRVAGQYVDLGAQVGHNVSLAGQGVKVLSPTTIAGDLSVGAQSVIVDGRIARDMYLATSTATINGQVGRNLNATDERLILGDGAAVGGGVYYTSSTALDRANGAKVSGEVVQHQPTPQAHRRHVGPFVGIAAAAYFFFAVLLGCLVLILLLPRMYHQATSRALKQKLQTFLVGVIASIMVPVAIVGLMLTVIGLPLALFLMLAWFVVCLLSGTFAAYATGRLIWRQAGNAISIMLVGAVVLLVLSTIPIVNILVLVTAFWFGVGTVLLYLLSGSSRSYATATLEGATSKTKDSHPQV